MAYTKRDYGAYKCNETLCDQVKEANIVVLSVKRGFFFKIFIYLKIGICVNYPIKI